MLTLTTHWLTPTDPKPAPGSAPARDLVVVGPSLGTGVVALWQECARELAGLIDVDVLAWDLPGHGDGAPAREPFTLQDLAGAVVAAVALAAPGVAPGSWTHAGVSVGGATGLHLALAGAVRASAVVCSGPQLGSPEGWAERAEQVREHGTASMVDGSRERWFAPGFLERGPHVAARLLDTLRAADDESYALVCGALGQHDVRDRLGQITVPVLALGGAADPVAPPQVQEDLAAAVPGAEAVVLPGVGHLAPAEAPVATAEALARWLLEL
ncbi:alpha/beta fold hydrolase [Ornithinimicrobium tianjinense]|nr:alpha/beta hydrolase [Ornithinimicrobium tianjinense]